MSPLPGSVALTQYICTKNMNRTYKIIFIVAGAVLALVIGIVLVLNLRSNPGGQTPGGDLPEYVLSAAEEQQVREFVKSFASLYNTYTYGDATNIIALGDYQTPSMQERSVGLASELEETLSEGYQKSTEIQEGSFQYQYPEAMKLTVAVNGIVTETASASSTPEQYPVDVSLTLERTGTVWRVDTITYTKTNN